MRQLKPKWTINWQGVDKRQLVDALRRYKDTKDREFWDKIAGSMEPLFDDDHDNICASVEVTDLWQVQQILAATCTVKADHGVALHCYASDDTVSIGASLCVRGGAFEESSAQVSVKVPSGGKFHLARKALYEARASLDEAEQCINIAESDP